MEKKVRDFFKIMLPLIKRRKAYNLMKEYLSKREAKDLKYFFKINALGVYYKQYSFHNYVEWPQTIVAKEDSELKKFSEKINKKIENQIVSRYYNKIAKQNPIDKIAKLIAPNIIGYDLVKKAVAAQLFSKESIHILLLGDPGTGKTDILRSTTELSPISSFGLGSGTTGAGLTVVKNPNYKKLKRKIKEKKNEKRKNEKNKNNKQETTTKDEPVEEIEPEFLLGLLPQANNGLCCIDELNLMQTKDKAGLYSAMEKGFITYDKGGKHKSFEAKIKVLATANPTNDRFIGNDIKFLKTQLPFKEALLSRFHLLFIFRKASEEELIEITKKIVNNKFQKRTNDKEFVKEFVKHASMLNVSLPTELEPMVVNFIEDLKKEEKKFFMEISPRTVIGIIRLAKAFSRARLSRIVSQDDLEEAMKLMKETMRQDYKRKKK